MRAPVVRPVKWCRVSHAGKVVDADVAEKSVVGVDETERANESAGHVRALGPTRTAVGGLVDFAAPLPYQPMSGVAKLMSSCLPLNATVSSFFHASTFSRSWFSRPDPSRTERNLPKCLQSFLFLPTPTSAHTSRCAHTTGSPQARDSRARRGRRRSAAAQARPRRTRWLCVAKMARAATKNGLRFMDKKFLWKREANAARVRVQLGLQLLACNDSHTALHNDFVDMLTFA